MSHDLLVPVSDKKSNV